MAIVVIPTENDLFGALRAFIGGLVPTGTPVLKGQANRVAEPNADDYVLITSPLRRERIATNRDIYADAAYTASIADTVMTVTAVVIGPILINRTLFGANLAAGSQVTAQLTGTAGGVGTYRVSPSQTVASERIASGAIEATQATNVVTQIDVHGPASADNAQIIATMFRDLYATDLFAATGLELSPLYASDPRQLPFVNDQQQYENRWVIELALQANEVVLGVPQQFADQIDTTFIDVTSFYPAA